MSRRAAVVFLTCFLGFLVVVTTAKALAEVAAADRPRARAGGPPQTLRHSDLLPHRCLVCMSGVASATIRKPGGVQELEAALVAVACVQMPAAARLAPCDPRPVMCPTVHRKREGGDGRNRER